MKFMRNELAKVNPDHQGKFAFTASLALVALAYLAVGRLGLAHPYLGTHITLIWLPTGIAVAALMRWGYRCWPGIFIGALATNYSVDAHPLLDICIALGNTLAPLLVAWFLRRMQFRLMLDRAQDIVFLVIAAAAGMLISAGGGVASLVLFGMLPVQDAETALLSWWAGDFMGVLLAAPLLLNITGTALHKLWAQRTEVLVWLSIMLASGWAMFFLNNDARGDSMPVTFLLLPFIVWSATRFGIAGSSLGVLLAAVIATVATSLGMGPFHGADARQNLFFLWLFQATLVFINLMVAALQAGRNRAEEALRQESEFDKELIQSLPGIFYMLDTSGRFLMWNKQLEEVLQRSGDEISRSHALEFFDGDDRRLIEENIRRVFSQGDTAVEAVLVTRNGGRIPYFFTGRRIEHDGKPVLVGMGVDMAARKNAEQAILEAKERIEIIFNTSPYAVLITRLSDGNITDVNEAFTRLTGYTKDDLLGKSTIGINFWVDPADRARYVHELTSKGFVENFEVQFRRKDGGRFTCSVTAAVSRIQGVEHIIGSARDITEQLRIEKEKQSFLKRYQTLMDTAVDGIHIVDNQGNLVEANDAFCSMLGYSRNEISGLSVADIDAKWSREELLERWKKFIQNRSSATFETVHRRKDGTPVHVEISCTVVEIEDQPFMLALSRDITERKRAERKNEVLIMRHQALMKSALEGIHIMDLEGNIIEANETFCKMLGYTREEAASLNVADWDAQWSREELLERFKKLHRAESALFETRHRRKDGSLIDVEVSTAGAEIDGQFYLYASSRDITQRKVNEEGQRIAAVTFDTQEAIMITTPDAEILRVNQAFSEITGYSKEDVIGKNPRMFQSGRHDAAFYRAMWTVLRATGKWSGEVWDKRKNGSIYPKMMTITAVYDTSHDLTHYVAVFRDISKVKQSELEIHQLAFYDPLTSLPNRRLLMDRLHQGLAVSARSGRYGALLFLDLDHFKTINDTRGHATGDLLLIEAARRLQTCVREGDSVARLGGDEFVVLLEGLDSGVNEAASQTETVAEKIQHELDKPYVLDDIECHLTASIGISLFIDHGESVESLLQHADVAMYQAKSAGRNAIRFFDPQMQAALDARAALEADMRHALNKQQFCLHYQVQVDSLQRALGAEVLLRWNHPVHGLISPVKFIPLAEESGLILPIGLWVLQTACAQLKAWQDNVLTRDLTLAVNVSARQFRQADFVLQVQQVLQQSGAKPSLLKLELTESIVLENVEDTIAKMRELKLLGVSFSMDDFGTGYSSLQYLKRLPLDQIKIDQSFVRDIATDPNDAAIVQTIIAMTEALGLHVIAEGVETREQLEFLDLRGCHAFQGYLFSRPVPLGQFEAVLREKSNSSRHSNALP
ncbi:MAG: PAS domain S-box protein [Gallionella sp.]